MSGPAALAFLGAGDAQSLRRIHELEASHGPAWPAAWLTERGLTEWAAELEAHLGADSSSAPLRDPEDPFSRDLAPLLRSPEASP